MTVFRQCYWELCKSDSDPSRICHEFVTGPLQTQPLQIFPMLTVTGFSKVRRLTSLFCHHYHRISPTDPDRSRRATTLVPVFPNRCSIHRVLIRIGSKFSLSIALSFQFPLFQESETPFFWHIHGGFVYVVQLKLKEAKSGNFIHFIIRHKTLFCVSGLYSAWINMAVVSNAITQSQEYISFRSTVPLRRVGVGKRCN